MSCIKKIAVITAYMEIEYSSELLRGIEQEAKENSIDLYIFNADFGSLDNVKYNCGQQNIFRLANFDMFDGVIVFSNLLDRYEILQEIQDRLIRKNIPIVGVDAPMQKGYYVGVENYRAMKVVVEHFLDVHGFKRIEFVTGPDQNSDSQVRLAAYCDALKEHGIPLARKRIHMGSFTNEYGRRIVEEIIASKKELPEAIVCGNDNIAIGVCDALKKHGIDVPGQVCVSGFDNIFEARNHIPRITSVDRSLVNVGKAAVRKIYSHYNGGTRFSSELFATVPIFSESCGCNGSEHISIEAIRRKYLRVVDRYEKNLVENNFMIEELNDSKSYDDFLRRLKPHVEILEADRFYLCLDKNLIEGFKINAGRWTDTEVKEKDTILKLGYAKMMTVALAYEKGTFVEYPDILTSNMLPDFDDEGNDSRHTFIFSPVHFQDLCLGYVVTENSDYVRNSEIYRSWMANLSNELENLRKHMNLRKMYDRLDKLYVCDSLTNAYNRAGFFKHSRESFEDCCIEGRPMMIFFADLDNLKVINDSYGHDKGDLAITLIAYSLRRACKGSEVVARFGGDEFVAFAADYSEEKALKFAQRFQYEVEHYNKIIESEFEISASFGYIVEIPKKNDNLEDIIKNADAKMYINKKAKKERKA